MHFMKPLFVLEEQNWNSILWFIKTCLKSEIEAKNKISYMPTAVSF